MYIVRSHLGTSTTAIRRIKYRIPSDLRSQAPNGLVSTIIGDGMGKPSAVVFLHWVFIASSFNIWLQAWLGQYHWLIELGKVRIWAIYHGHFGWDSIYSCGKRWSHSTLAQVVVRGTLILEVAGSILSKGVLFFCINFFYSVHLWANKWTAQPFSKIPKLTPP